jgi:hypothetical protein
MPRLIVLRPPGGDSGVRRRRYTAREKIAITAKIHHIKRETNCSYHQAVVSIGVSHTLVIRWYAIRERFNNIDIKKLPCYSFIPLPYYGIGEVVHIPGGCTTYCGPNFTRKSRHRALGSALPAAPASSQYHGCKALGIVSRILDTSGISATL